MKIELYRIEDNYPFELLLLADETVEAINRYLYDSDVYVVDVNEKQTVGVFCLFPISEETVEIKNIAVAPEFQDQGIGGYLLSRIEEIVRKKKYREIIVGTGDGGQKQIHFYEKNGYSKYGIRENFFLDNYERPIYENGVMLKDMVMFRKEIQKQSEIMKIEKAAPKDYSQIMEVWESSVKATHDFLKPEDFLWYKDVIPTDYLPNLDLYVLRSNGKVLGVLGMSGEDLEMLFISGTSRGKGYGKALLEFAVRKLNAKRLDVNEQNTQALGFYEKFGFKVTGRSEKDGMGKDYPILHLSLLTSRFKI